MNKFNLTNTSLLTCSCLLPRAYWTVCFHFGCCKIGEKSSSLFLHMTATSKSSPAIQHHSIVSAQPKMKLTYFLRKEKKKAKHKQGSCWDASAV